MTTIGSASIAPLSPLWSSNKSAQTQNSLAKAPLEDTPGSSGAAKDAVIESFLKWAKMSPVERIRAQYLESHGLTEESLKALPPEEREKIEQEIAEKIKEKIGGQGNKSTGLLVDQTA